MSWSGSRSKLACREVESECDRDGRVRVVLDVAEFLRLAGC